MEKLDTTKGLARKRVQLNEAFEKMKEKDKDFAYEIRISMLVDIRKFDTDAYLNQKGVIIAIPSPVIHFHEAERQRTFSRNSAKLRRSKQPE